MVRGLIFRIRTNSPPGSLDQILTQDGRAASITVFYPDHKGETIREAVRVSQQFIAENPLGEISVRLDERRAAAGATLRDPERWKDLLYYMIGPLLPARAHTLSVRIRDGDGYDPVPVRTVVEHGLPDWIGGSGRRLSPGTRRRATRSARTRSSPGRSGSGAGTPLTSTSGGRIRTSACAPWR
jgi:hypothetical protein